MATKPFRCQASFSTIPSLGGHDQRGSAVRLNPLLNASAVRSELFLRSHSSRHGSLVSNVGGFTNVHASAACFSSTSSSSESKGGVSGWMQRRKEKQEHEKYLEQMERLANMEELTLDNYRKELETGLSGWGTNIKFLQTKEVKVAKEVVDAIKCLIDVMGPNVTIDDINTKMTHIDRLKVATTTNKSLPEVSALLAQIQNMDIMQRVLRKRKLEGKPIPKDANSLQHAIKADAMSVVTKSQKAMMKKRSMDMATRMARKHSR